ncbi:response regulator transcription factor [Rhodococcus sp. G-MC3]|uniref:response regulator transcription factor n=1 Tax=Rhodococcus sp. G-MC3 TaxID=3046209 RepID=UPI0024BA43AC|nr:response regulator transcription factor [Rhodococcus sp. G-MC3]MDJ0395060.1 response regulator transcription factor [Rhodococcus sp. G-MC3]
MKDTPIRVVLADDHTLFRDGLAALIETDPAFTVVAHCPDGTTAIDTVAAVVPDIAVLDIEMPGPGAHAVISAILARVPSVAIVVLSMHENPVILQNLLDAGASAFLAKTVDRSQLIAGLHAVIQNPENVTVSTSRKSHNENPLPAENPLSPREIEVLRLVAEARSNRQIGRELGITESTVKRHLTNVYAKLGAVSRVDCIRKASGRNFTTNW